MKRSLELSPTSEKGYERARAALHREMAAWAEDRGVAADSGQELLHYKWGYLDGRLGCWTVADLDAVLLELFPAKMIVEPDELDGVLDEARAFIEFLAEAGHLDPDSDDPAILCRHIERLGPRFRRRMADQGRYSWGKRMWLAMMADGVPLDNEQAVQAWMEEFNARTYEQRAAVLGSPLAAPPSRAARRASARRAQHHGGARRQRR